MSGAETVAVPGTTAGVREALDAIEAFSRRREAPDSLRRRMLTVLDEVLSNIVRHSRPRLGEPIVITASHDGAGLVIDVADASGPFNPLLLPPPDTTSPLEERRQGGLGIALVRALADEVCYERRDERNHLTMTWRMTPGEDETTNAHQ